MFLNCLVCSFTCVYVGFVVDFELTFDVPDRSHYISKYTSKELQTIVVFLFLAGNECSPILDLAFIVDSSGSIGRRNWARLKRFLMSVTSKLDVGQGKTQVSAIAYSSDPKVEYRFTDRQSTEEVNALLEGMAWQRGYTYIDKALMLADRELFTAPSGMRSNAAKVSSHLISYFLYYLPSG